MISFRSGLHKLLTCRRSVIALTGILACLGISLHNGADTSASIAMIVAAVAGANAYQAKGNSNDAPR